MTSSQNMIERVAKAICKSRTCEGYRCCQWPAQGGRTQCPVRDGGYDDAARAAIEAIVAAADEVPYDPHGAEVTLLHHWFAEHYSAAEWMDDGCRSENARDLLNAMSKAGFIVVPLRTSLTGDTK